MYGLNEEQTEKLAEISVETMKGVRGMSMMLGIAKPGEPLYAGMAGAMWTDDSEAFMEPLRRADQGIRRTGRGRREVAAEVGQGRTGRDRRRQGLPR